MKPSKTVPGRTHDTARRWRVPPAPLAATSGPEGVAVLEEVRGETGVILWRTLRRINTWAATPSDARRFLDYDRSGERRLANIEATRFPLELHEPVVRLLRLKNPWQSQNDSTTSEAAARIAEWAVANAYWKTAAEFFQAAANASPESAAYALAAGRATRDLADYPRAEAWLQRTIALARQEKDWAHYASAYLAMARMMTRRGNMPAARRYGERSLRRSIREGYQELQAMSWHDLFVIEFECGNWELAERYAGEALATYPTNHPTLTWLAHDIGYLRMTEGAFADALRIFTVLAPRIPAQRKPHIFGALAYAAGGCGDHVAFEHAREILAGLEVNPGTAEAWLEVARGALHLGRMDEAREAARTSRDMASERSEHKIVFEAEAFEESCVTHSGDAEVEEATQLPDRAEHFAERVIRKLATV